MTSVPTIDSAETSADIQIFFDEEISESAAVTGPVRTRNAEVFRWLLLMAPWCWFVVRPLHPVTELIAIGMPLICYVAILLSVVLLFVRRSIRSLLLVGSIAAFSAVVILLPGRPSDLPEPQETSRIATVNVARQWFSSNDLGFLVFDEQPDILVASEISDSHDRELRSRFSFGVSDVAGQEPNPDPPEIGLANSTDAGPVGFREFDQPSIGVYSDFEIERLEDPLLGIIDGGLPGFRLRVNADSGPYILYALHIPKIGTGGGAFEVGVGEQRDLVNAISDSAQGEELPVMITGDLNIVDRGESYAQLTGAFDDAMRQSRWAGPTRGRNLLHILLRLRIDHVLLSPGLCVAETPRALDVFYTDHAPLIADIGPCN